MPSSMNPFLRLKSLQVKFSKRHLSHKEVSKEDFLQRNYEYNPLESTNSFRVLELLPLKDGDDIQISLHATTLDKAPAYQTLSYEWGVGGNAERRNPITCDGCILLITDNLKTALRRLRFPTLRRFIWADAICINQEDMNERGQQVGLMKDIYAFSHQTLIWLGEEGPYTSEAFQALKSDAKLSKEQPHARFEDPYDQAWMDWSLARYPWLVYSERSELLSKNARMGMQDLFNRSYFGRMWIIQEVVHAQRAIVMCGTQEIDWTEFARGSGYSLAHGAQHQHNFLSTIKSIENLRKIERKEADQLTFLEIIKSFPRSNATDPLDNIYSLLSLSKEGLNIVPNYNISPVEAFQNFFEGIGGMESHGFLYNFYYPPCKSPIEGLPTWVPNFSRPNPNRELIMKIQRNAWHAMDSTTRAMYFRKHGISAEGDTFPAPRQWLDVVDNKFRQNVPFDGKVTRVCDIMSEDDLTLLLREDDLISTKEHIDQAISALISAEGKTVIDANDSQSRPKYVSFKSLPTFDIKDISPVGESFLFGTSVTTELFRNEAGRQLFMLDSGLVGVGPEGEGVQIGDECANLEHYGWCIIRADSVGGNIYTIRGPVLWSKWMKTRDSKQLASHSILIR